MNNKLLPGWKLEKHISYINKICVWYGCGLKYNDSSQ